MSFDTATMQLVTYTALTLASVTVAGVSLLIAYRQNFGWEPIVFVTGTGLRNASGHDRKSSDPNDTTLTFEFWNRRKYPVVVRDVTVESDAFDLNEFWRVEDRLGWIVHPGGKLLRIESLRLEPNGHHVFTLRSTSTKRVGNDIIKPVHIAVRFFDVKRNRYRIAAGHTKTRFA